MPTLVPTTPTRSSHDEVHEGKVVLKTMDIKAQPLPELNTEKKPSTSTHDLEGNSEPHLTPQPPVQQEPEMDAIDRLVSVGFVVSSGGYAGGVDAVLDVEFMSTPLAIELSLTIGADESLTVVLVVITGILISIFKDPFFRLFGLNPDQDGPNNDDGEGEEGEKGGKDYLTIGIAMGSTAGAIGASSLISKPRSMAIASLSFVLFGAILLIFAAIPPIVDTLRTLTNAPLEFTPASS
ncbi:hypothetical protein [Sporisorium scitamineum]|uniref:Uncharacterized protein n=1 Tax=Sporisorium scitamineum TaxID=49012 RepID=A0A0F7S7A5_9BASI|nr:hypothetical protein [Sporisorium scitamineum]